MIDTTRLLTLSCVAATLALGCDSNPEDSSEDPSTLALEVNASGLDEGRLRFGLFEVDGEGTYTSAGEPRGATIRLSAHPADGDRVTASVFDDEGPVDPAEIQAISMRPIQVLTIEELGSLDELELEAPLPYPTTGRDSAEDRLVTVVPLVWYDDQLNDTLDLDFEGESETVRALTLVEGERLVTLTNLDFEWVFQHHSPEGGTAEYESEWTAWAMDLERGATVVLDWTTVWTVTLDSATEAR